MITISGMIGMVVVVGSYPLAGNPDDFIGKYVHELKSAIDDTYYIMDAVRNTILNGQGVTVHTAINGHRRIGMTIPVNHRYAILRIFAPRS